MTIPPPPASTYRLQFHAGFTFDDARRLVPYLHEKLTAPNGATNGGAQALRPEGNEVDLRHD